MYDHSVAILAQGLSSRISAPSLNSRRLRSEGNLGHVLGIRLRGSSAWSALEVARSGLQFHGQVGVKREAPPKDDGLDATAERRASAAARQHLDGRVLLCRAQP